MLIGRIRAKFDKAVNSCFDSDMAESANSNRAKRTTMFYDSFRAPVRGSLRLASRCLSDFDGVAAFVFFVLIGVCLSHEMGSGEWFGIGAESADPGVIGVSEGARVLQLAHKGSEENPREPGVGL